MPTALIILAAEAIIMYFLVLGVHSLRDRWGTTPFYALLGGATAVMSWVTDAGLTVEVAGVTFMVGSTVFYTSLLLGVFVVYVFDGPRAARIAIATVAGISTMMPLTAAVLNLHMGSAGASMSVSLPQPSLRINAASVATTLVDLVFLAMAWEFMGKPGLRMKLWFRTWLTLLGVMWLDVFLFSSAAFGGTPGHVSIMQGTLVSRLFISLFALPFLYFYLRWQAHRQGVTLQQRPVLAILRQVAETEAELSRAEQEIERRREAERVLRETNALLDATGKLANVGGWQLELPSMEVSWTEQTRLMHEVPPDYEPSLDEALSFFPGEHRTCLRAALERAVERGEPYDLELDFVTAAGYRRRVQAVCEPVVIGGETVALRGAFQDITERKAMEARLHQQKRMAAVGQMASGIAHDFRNRINAILLYAEMVLNQDNLGRKTRQRLETIISESHGITDLVQQILDFSGQSMFRLQCLDLGNLVPEIARDLGPKLPDGIDIRVATEPGGHMVEGDPRRLRQAVENLISNADDAMPDGGRVGLTVARVAHTPESARQGLEDAGEVSDEPPTEWICLTVADTGTGMTEEVYQHLFEPFFTTKDIDAGTGLGLAQVYGIVRQHRGLINVETALGEGTVVRIYLPSYADDPEPRSQQPAGHDERPLVLLVEPDAELRGATRDLLGSRGYRVLTARDGREAQAMQQSPRWSQRKPSEINVLVAPLEMPRMGAEALLAELRRTDPGVRAVGISDRALDEEAQVRLREAGFAEVAVRPVKIEVLSHVLVRVLEEQGPRGH